MFFFFNDTATTEIYTLSLHDALPIWLRRQGEEQRAQAGSGQGAGRSRAGRPDQVRPDPDRKSTRLNSSHSQISYAVFCLKKKKRCNVNLGGGLYDKSATLGAVVE